MKCITLLLSFLVITIINYAQDINYYSGATIQNDENASTKFFQQDENNLYAFTYLNPVYYLDVFDKDSLLRQSHIKIPLPAKDSLKYTIENLFILKDKFLVFYSYFSKTESAERLEMIAFDQNGNKTEAAKLIDQLPGKNDKKAGTFVVKNIASKNNFLSYGYKKVKGAYALNIDHFDYNGNKLKSQDFSLDKSGFLVHSIYNDETICRLTQSTPEPTRADWSLSFYSPDADKPVVLNLNPPEAGSILIASAYRYYLDENETLHLLAPYISNIFSKKAKGVYWVQVDLNKKSIISRRGIPFKLEASGDEDEADFSLASCILTDIIPLKNGLRVLFEGRLLTSTYGVPTSYNFGNIISVDIDSSDNIYNIDVVRKKQIASPTKAMYLGYAALTSNDTTYCIYNDLPQNLERNEKVKNMKGGQSDETIIVSAALLHRGIKKSAIIEKEKSNESDVFLPQTIITDRFRKGTIYGLRKKDKNLLLTRFFR